MPSTQAKLVAAATAALLISLPKDEGVRYTPYYDIAGVPTVCYGHTGADVIMGKKYTEQECLDFLKKDVERHTNVVLRCANTQPSVNQLAAFTSFDFNTGGWCISRSRKEFNAGNFSEACRALAYGPTGKPAWSYIKRGTVYVEGLHKRRIRESNLCMKE